MRGIKLDQNANANHSDVIEERLPNFEVVTVPYTDMAVLERPISATEVRRMSVAAATAAAATAEVTLGSRRVVRPDDDDDDDKEDEVLVHRPFGGTPSAGIVCAPGRYHNCYDFEAAAEKKTDRETEKKFTRKKKFLLSPFWREGTAGITDARIRLDRRA